MGIEMNSLFELGKNEEVVKDYFIGTHATTGARVHLAITSKRIISYGSAQQESIGSKHYFYYLNDMKLEDFAGVMSKNIMDKMVNWGKIVLGIILIIISILPILIGHLNEIGISNNTMCIIEGVIGIVGLVLLIIGIVGDMSYSVLIQIKSRNMYGGITMIAGRAPTNNYFLTSGANLYTTGSWLYVVPTEEMYRMVSEISAIVLDLLNGESEELEEDVI